MDVERWIKKHSDTYVITSGFVTGPMIRVKDFRELLRTHAIVPVELLESAIFVMGVEGFDEEVAQLQALLTESKVK